MKNARAVIIADLLFGDSGKGTMTDWFARELAGGDPSRLLVVRYNGGAQAGHTVVTADGRRHTFSQFGAGSFVEGVGTYLSKHMVVHPGGLLREGQVLQKLGLSVWAGLTIDPQALVITPFHQASGRLREILRGSGRHGSCGLGVGETVGDSLAFSQDAVRMGDFANPAALKAKLLSIQRRKWSEFLPQRNRAVSTPSGLLEFSVLESREAADEWTEQLLEVASLCQVANIKLDGSRHQNLVFEGAQGVLLDEWRGFHPHTTWSTCTFANALGLLRDWPGPVERVGVMRSYATRHGAGPFPTEDPTMTTDEPDNHHGPWQGAFRLGHLDIPLLRYALEACGGVDSLALTHLDRVTPVWPVATNYQNCELVLGPAQDLNHQGLLTRQLEQARPVWQNWSGPQVPQLLGQALGFPIVYLSDGPTADHKKRLALTPNG